MSQSSVKEWCERNEVRISFYEREGETHLLHFVGLSKDDLHLEIEFNPNDPDSRSFVVAQARVEFERMMRRDGTGMI
jgi:hypothetical protein